VSGTKPPSAVTSRPAQIVAYRTVSPSVTITAPLACRPIRPVSMCTSLSPIVSVSVFAVRSMTG
jgi:hypothetical protein